MASIFPIRTLPQRLWRRLTAPLARHTAPAGGESRFWAIVHYAAVSPAFQREQRAVLAGHQAYAESLDAPRGTLARLRRNVHRLEKGILMRPRRIPFALDYIADTVRAFETAVGAGGGAVEPTELAWANDVLTEYFAIHAEASSVDDARRRFEAVRFDPAGPSRRVPYRRDLESPVPVSLEQLRSLAMRRRSVRWFLQRPVERERIDRALEVGAQAPSACNRQPFRLQIFDDPELVRQAIDLPMGLVGYGHQVPVVAVVVGQQRHFFDERDRHLIYIDASLAVMGFILALETQGLASCCVNWPDIEEREVRMADFLQLDPDERPVMLIAIGYPDPEGLVANSTKKSLSQLRSYNFE